MKNESRCFSLFETSRGNMGKALKVTDESKDFFLKRIGKNSKKGQPGSLKYGGSKAK